MRIPILEKAFDSESRCPSRIDYTKYNNITDIKPILIETSNDFRTILTDDKFGPFYDWLKKDRNLSAWNEDDIRELLRVLRNFIDERIRARETTDFKNSKLWRRIKDPFAPRLGSLGFLSAEVGDDEFEGDDKFWDLLWQKRDMFEQMMDKALQSNETLVKEALWVTCSIQRFRAEVMGSKVFT